METLVVIVSMSFTVLCGVVLYKCIISTLDSVEEIISDIRDIRICLNNIVVILKEK